ncbi:MAG TPA: alanine--tRNA ligase [Actinomycetes bacterium]|nr:alanine--tRNA ligase [Actinomycetes bacterium]
METAEIRRRWLRFFGERGHVVVPSASLLLDDPNLLFVNAGMVPFKPYFLGQQAPPWPRATSVQKCVRTQDIDEVGKTSRHGTFFQMNGNFSFGDYFKEGAITYAWDLVTRPQSEGGFGLPEDKLWVTVYLDDEEAIALWQKVAGLPIERIVRRGKKDNYWNMGVPGPGGPCSEIYLDRGPEYGPEGGPDVDEDRFLEFWNLVFMQEELSHVRSKEDFDVLGPLPAQNIDTGMGLERIASILQGVDNLYEIDEVRPVLDRAAELAGKTYGRDHDDDVRLRVVADHVRTGLMLAGDGVTPGNEGRGYVLRRMLRRVVRSMRLLGVDEPVLPELLPVSLERMKASYPELESDWERITTVTYAEEESFRHTLRAGEQHFSAITSSLGGGLTVPGEEAFRLHDTYGFPIDLTLEMAGEAGLTVDEEGFRRLMAEQRRRAKADAQAKKTGHADVSAYRAVGDRSGPTTFLGYEQTTADATVAGLVVDGEPAEYAREGQEVEVVLDRTPFYAEGGGQLGDTGRIELDNGTVLEVLDVQAPLPGLSVHRARVAGGEVRRGQLAEAVVDLERRLAISRAHTATHMVHKAFREALGETATQMGSENSPGRLRFDFPNPAAVPPSVLGDVEARVNDVLLDDLAVTAEQMTQEQARAIGAMALFGEKYGERVRVVSVGDWARELCGGTHTHRTGQLGVVKIVGESSIGAGVRRIEALVGADAYRFLAREHVLVSRLSEALKARPEELPERVESIVARLREAERDLERLRRAQLLADVDRLVGPARDVAGIAVQAFAAPEGTDAGALRQIVLDARGRVPQGSAALVAGLAAADGKVSALVVSTPAAVERGVSARTLLQALLAHVDGRGGGKDDVAQGGGTSPAGIPAALAAVDDAVRSTVRA